MQFENRKIDDTKNKKLLLLQHFVRLCYYQNVSYSDFVPSGQDQMEAPWCPRTFDGFTCWDTTPAGATAFQPCPNYVIGFDPRLIVFKRCTLNGTWATHPLVVKPWTNYTTCVNVDDLSVETPIGPLLADQELYNADSERYAKMASHISTDNLNGFRYMVNDIYVTGYSVSVAALLISLAIFMYYRTLHCTRIRIHMHLFSSFALNNILWIVWYKTVVNTVSVVQDNKVWCQFLHIITNYFMVTSYFWMFCEGLHLHIALVVVFVKDEIAMQWFKALGWGLSLVVTIVYATARYYSGSTERCWMDHSDTFWIIITPVVVSLISSFVMFTVFLVNVVRVLLAKLNPAPNLHASMATKKATRAALILIPLFGLHFILIPLRPSPDSPGEQVYQVFSALLTGLQGLCVAVLFCFTNQDVVTAIKAHIARFTRRTSGAGVIPMTGVTGGESNAV